MPCKNGQRENIDASRDYYRRQREYDPERAFWLDLVQRVHQGGDDLQCLSEDERVYYTANCLVGEVHNGGMFQFFTNSSGRYFTATLDALERLSASESAWLLRRASALIFGTATPPSDEHIMQQSAENWLNSTSDRQHPESVEMDKIDHAFRKGSDDLITALSRFAEETGVIAPFLTAPQEPTKTS